MLCFVRIFVCDARFPPVEDEACAEKGYVCEPAFWSINVPNGKYFVRVTTNDRKNSFINNLQVNDVGFFDNSFMIKSS